MTTTHSAGRHRLANPRLRGFPGWGSASVILAAGAAGWLVAVLDGDGPRTMTIQPPAQAAPVQVPAQAVPAADIQRAGQVTEVSGSSLTTRGADGQLTTFAIMPDTTHVTSPGAAAPFAPGAVAPAQNVVVVGVIEHGVPVATLVADPAAVVDPAAVAGAGGAAGPTGAPMDYHLPT